MAAPVILIEATPRVAATGVAQTVRLAGGGAEVPCRYGGVDWRAGLDGLPRSIQTLAFDGEQLGGGGTAQALEVRWGAATNALLAELAALYWTDAPVTVRIGPEDASFALPAIAQSGLVLDSGVEDGRLRIALADAAVDLARALLTDRFAGSGGVEGPVEWTNKIKERCWGRCFNVPGQLLDKANNIWCFGDPTRAWQSFDQVRDQGVPAAAGTLTVLAWQGSVAATFAALQAAVATAGGGVLCPSIACIKWWTQPAGDLHADVRGETAGGYVETAPEIAQRIVAARSTLAFAPGAVAGAAAARPAPCGWRVANDSAIAADELSALLAGVSLSWTIVAGAIELRAWDWTASTRSARSYAVTRRSVGKPVTARKLGYHQNQAPMARGDLAGAVLIGDVLYPDGSGAAAAIAGAQATASAALSAGASLIYNGDAELGTIDGWWNGPQSTGSGNQFVAVSGEQARGAWSFRIQKGVAGNINSATAKAIAVTPGQRMVFRAQTRGSDPTGAGTIFIRLMEAAAMPVGGFVTGSSYTELFNGGATTPFYQHQYSYTVPAGINAVSPVIFNVAGGPTTFVIDDVQLFDATDFANVIGATKDALVAQSAASTAAIAIIVSDGYLSRDEKPAVIREVADIVNEYPTLTTQAAALSVSTTTYAAAYSALVTTYLPSLSPAWNNTAADTAITAATFQGKFNDYYYARQLLANALDQSASTSAIWSKTSNDNGKKPVDNAGTSLSLIALGNTANVALQGNRGTAQGATGYVSAVQTRDTYKGSALLTARALTPAVDASRFVMCLVASTNTSGTNSYTAAIGISLVFIGGSAVSLDATGATRLTGPAISSGDVLGVFLSGSTVQVLVNGVAFDSIAVTAGQTVSGHFALFTNGAFTDAQIEAAVNGAQLDPASGRAVNARILRMWMTAGAAAAIYNVNPLSISRASGVSTITINAHSITDDAGTISYSAGSIGGLTAAPGSQYAVYEDGAYTGGARTYVATLNATDLAGSPDRRYVGTVVVPADGATGTGAGNGQPGGRGTTNPLP